MKSGPVDDFTTTRPSASTSRTFPMMSGGGPQRDRPLGLLNIDSGETDLDVDGPEHPSAPRLFRALGPRGLRRARASRPRSPRPWSRGTRPGLARRPSIAAGPSRPEESNVQRWSRDCTSKTRPPHHLAVAANSSFLTVADNEAPGRDAGGVTSSARRGPAAGALQRGLVLEGQSATLELCGHGSRQRTPPAGRSGFARRIRWRLQRFDARGARHVGARAKEPWFRTGVRNRVPHDRGSRRQSQ